MSFHRVFFLFLILSQNLFAQATDSTQKAGFFHKLYWDPLSILSKSKNQEPKNIISGQILGNTPYLGMAYSRIFPLNAKFKIESGLGIGLTPHLFVYNKNSQDLSYSHHLLLYKKINHSFGLYTGYSGIFYNGFNYRGKIYNYLPSPQLGIRFGNSKPISMNFNWTFYFAKEDFVKFKEPDIVMKGVISKMLGSIGVGLNYSF